MSKFSLVLVVGIAIIGIGIYFFVAPEISNDPGIFPQEGISVLHSDNISVTDIEFDLHVTDNPQKFLINFDLLFNDKEEPGFVAFVIPYPGGLGGLNAEHRHCWTSKPFFDAEQRLIFRDFPCKEEYEEIDFYKDDSVHIEWQYEIYGNVDSIKAFSHKSRLMFLAEPNSPEFLKFTNKEFSGNLVNTWLEDDFPQEAKITVSDFFEERISIPETESKPYRNENNESPNDFSYIWEIGENNSLFTLEFSTSKELWQAEFRPLLAPVFFSVGASFLVMSLGHYFSVEHNQKKARQVVIRDFNWIHGILVSILSSLRNELLPLNPNSGRIDDLLRGRKTPHEVMLLFVRGLLFRSWDANLHRISDLDPSESDVLSELHGYIIQSNENEELRIHPIVEQMENILRNTDLSDSQKRDEIYNLLKSNLSRRLVVYDTIYHRLHSELKTIGWIKLPTEHFR